MKPSRFDALATVLYTENEITPETMNLREDSFKTPASGYTPEDWMKIDYRKRRYITLRDRAKVAGTPGIAKPSVTPTASIKVPPADLDAPEAEVSPDPTAALDTDDTEAVDGEMGDLIPTSEPDPIEEPDTETSAFTDAIVDYVTTNSGKTRQDLFDFVSRSFGDRLSTEQSVHRAINKAVGSGDIEFTDDDVAVIPGAGETGADEPSDADLKTVAATSSDEAKKKARLALHKKFMAWRAAKLAGADTKADDESDEPEDTDDEPDDATKPADAVLRKRGYNAISKSGIEDYEAADGDNGD